MDATIGQNAERLTGVDAAQRSQALADARQRSSQAALQTADAAQARKAEQREMLRSILEQAVGANTRLSIAKPDGADAFIYRAIDVDSGEVVREWPPAQFAQLLEQDGAARQLANEALAGLLIDEQA